MNNQTYRDPNLLKHLLEDLTQLEEENRFLLLKPKEKLRVLQDQLSQLLKEEREFKNNQDHPLFEYVLDLIAEQRAGLNKDIARIEWLMKPVKGEELNIQRAKLYPIPQLIEINRAKKAKCPWHDDKNPSLQYYPKKNTVHCFVCSQGGDSIDLAQALFSLTWKEAVIKLTR